jgi:hypothetical protein
MDELRVAPWRGPYDEEQSFVIVPHELIWKQILEPQTDLQVRLQPHKGP